MQPTNDLTAPSLGRLRQLRAIREPEPTTRAMVGRAPRKDRGRTARGPIVRLTSSPSSRTLARLSALCIALLLPGSSRSRADSWPMEGHDAANTYASSDPL